MNKTKKLAKQAFLLIAISVFAYSGYQLLGQHLTYREADREHEEILSIASQDEKEEEGRQIDFEALREINEDIIGWLYVEGAGIDHPIVQTTDNEHYLTTTFAGLSNPSGAIFADYRNAPDFSDSQTLIYGHNMLNDTMFSPLTLFQNQSFFDQYSSFRIYTSEAVFHYDIFSAYLTSAYSDTYFKALETGELFEFYLQFVTELSEIETGITPNGADRIVSLSTCEYQFEDARMIVHGRLVEVR